MDSWKAITAQLGQPDQRWPKHRGHLKQSDRFRLVAFLFLNDVPQPIIRKLSSTKQIYLRDAKAKTHWMSCVDVMNTPAKLHKYRTATYHKISTGSRVHLDGTPVPPPPATPAPRTTFTQDNCDSCQFALGGQPTFPRVCRSPLPNAIHGK